MFASTFVIKTVYTIDSVTGFGVMGATSIVDQGPLISVGGCAVLGTSPVREAFLGAVVAGQGAGDLSLLVVFV